MGYAIIWSPEAVEDLTRIREYVARDSDSYAAALMDRILGAIEQLAEFPRMGRRVPEIDDEAIRQLLVGPYRVLYRVRQESIHLAAVVHGARDVPAFIEGRTL